MIKSVICIQKCDGCGVEVEITDKNFVKFQIDWYESIKFDFCPDCQLVPKWAQKIDRDRKFKARVETGMEKRLMRNYEKSH